MKSRETKSKNQAHEKHETHILQEREQTSCDKLALPHTPIRMSQSHNRLLDRGTKTKDGISLNKRIFRIQYPSLHTNHTNSKGVTYTVSKPRPVSTTEYQRRNLVRDVSNDMGRIPDKK